MPVARTKSSRPVLKSNTTSGSTIKDSNIRQSEDGSEGEIDFLFPGEGAHGTVLKLKRPRHTSLKAVDQPTKEMKLLKMGR